MGLVLALAGTMSGRAQELLFSLKPGLLSLSECVAEPGSVAVPLAATNLNLEVVAWRTEAVHDPVPGRFTLVFKEPTAVGTLMVYEAGEVSYQVGENWETLGAGAEAGRSFQVLPFPEGVSVRAIRIAAPTRPAGMDAEGKALHRAELGYATLIPARVKRITEAAEVTTHCWSTEEAGRVLFDGRVDAVRNLPKGGHPIAETTPEWVMLKWATPQAVRGVVTLRGAEDGGLGSYFVEVFTGEGEPVATGQEGWERPVGRRTAPGPFRSSQFFVSFRPLTGRALRLMSREGGVEAGLGELIVTRDAAAPAQAGP